MKGVVVKRRGHAEPFDEKKAYGSIYWACKSSHMSAPQSELVSEKVVEKLKEHLRQHKQASSDTIFSFICKELEKHDKDSAYMYRTHRDIS